MANPKVIIVAIDSDEEPAGYGVVAEDTFNEDMEDVQNLFDLLYGKDERVDTFANWADAVKFVAECEGEIADVIGALAY